MKYLFTAVILLGLGCGQNNNQQSNTGKNADTLKSAVVTTTDTIGEYIDWTKVKLNGSIAMLSNLKSTQKELGKPDSIVTPKYEDVSASFFNGKTFKYVHYTGLEFETENDSLAFSQIDFRKAPALYLTTDKIKLSGTTTINEFKKLFPKAADEQMHGTDMDKYASFRLNMAPGNTDDAWILEFDTTSGKLLTVEYFIPD